MTNKEEFEKWAVMHGFDIFQWKNGVYKTSATTYVFSLWQEKQKEIDAKDNVISGLKLDQKICRSLYGNASREIERLREENAALKAEVERLKGDADRYQHILDCNFIVTKKYLPNVDAASHMAKLRAAHDAAMKETK